MKPSHLLAAFLFRLFASTGAQAQDTVHCKSITASPNGVTQTEIRVYPTADNQYAYYAVHCLQIDGTCSGDMDRYESAGPLKRDTYNGVPTLVFIGDAIRIVPSCGRTTVYIDEKTQMNFSFPENECVISPE